MPLCANAYAGLGVYVEQLSPFRVFESRKEFFAHSGSTAISFYWQDLQTESVSISGAPSACGPVSGRSQITFPFSAGLPDIEALRTAAQNQSSGVGNNDNYYELTSNANVVGSNPGATNVLWPANSTSSTVVFVKFDDIGDRLSWNVAGSCNDDPVKGTLVIENGTFTTQPNQRPPRGAIVINSGAPGTQVYSDTGNTCMESFAMAKGDTMIGGNVSPATQERGNSPSSYGLNLWSWRELYQ